MKENKEENEAEDYTIKDIISNLLETVDLVDKLRQTLLDTIVDLEEV